jgi:hypothetical protein
LAELNALRHGAFLQLIDLPTLPASGFAVPFVAVILEGAQDFAVITVAQRQAENEAWPGAIRVTLWSHVHHGRVGDDGLIVRWVKFRQL